MFALKIARSVVTFGGWSWRYKQNDNLRSSHPDVFCKKRAVEYFTKLTGKHFYRSLFPKNVSGRRPATLFEKRFFFCETLKTLQNCFFTVQLWKFRPSQLILYKIFEIMAQLWNNLKTVFIAWYCLRKLFPWLYNVFTLLPVALQFANLYSLQVSSRN